MLSQQNAKTKIAITSAGKPTPTLLYLGDSADVPQELPRQAGILVKRDSYEQLSYWNGEQWVSLNAAGWATTFHCPHPNVPIDCWALVHSLHLAASAALFYINLTKANLKWALHDLSHDPSCRQVPYALRASTLEDADHTPAHFADVADYVQGSLSTAGA